MVCGSHRSADTGTDASDTSSVRRGRVDGIDVLELNLPYSNHDGFVVRVWKFLRFALFCSRVVFTESYDLAFATSTPLTIAVPGVLAKWLRRKPFVFEVRDLWPEIPREMGIIRNPIVLGLMNALEWCAYRSADQLIALSPGIARGIERRGVPASRIHLISNGCDLELFSVPRAFPTWPIPNVEPEDFVAVFAGTHGLANGLSALVDVGAELDRRGRRDIKILFVGDGQQKEALVSRVSRLHLSTCVFLDSQPKHRLAELFAECDVGLQVLANVPAFYDGTSPNKFFDYIAAGLPVVNNYPGWLAGLIEERRCGVVVPPNDTLAFADALEALADHRERLAPMGQAARRLAQEQFSRERLAADFVHVLETTDGHA